MDEMVHLQKDIQHSDDIRVPIGWVGSVVMLEVTALIKMFSKICNSPSSYDCHYPSHKDGLRAYQSAKCHNPRMYQSKHFSSRDPHLHMHPLFVLPL